MLFTDIIYGPIRSRRLGISLGVNLLPLHSKLCNFDCIYCECGWNDDNRTEKLRFNAREDIRVALEATLAKMQEEGSLPGVITFAGNGEPTIHPFFADIIDDTIALRNKYCPNAKISVLSNATQITKDKVFDALKKVDNNILKLDTIDNDYISFLDRPTGKYNLNEIIERMKAFDGKTIIQTMFLKGEIDGFDTNNTTDKYVLPWIEAVKYIAPREVMIYTIDRETPQEGLLKATHEELDRIVALLEKEGIKASASY